MRRRLWLTFQDVTGIATDHLTIPLQEISSSNSMELGQIMQAVGDELVVPPEDDPLEQTLDAVRQMLDYIYLWNHKFGNFANLRTPRPVAIR